jgi:hypothetical protein
MNVEIGTEAAQFQEKEYIHVNGIFVAVHEVDPEMFASESGICLTQQMCHFLFFIMF